MCKAVARTSTLPLVFPLLLTTVQGKKSQTYSSPRPMLPVFPVTLGSTLASAVAGAMQSKADPPPLVCLWFSCRRLVSSARPSILTLKHLIYAN